MGDLFDRSDGSPTFRIIGWGQNEGVARNGGRVGAAGGPEAVLRRLPSCGPLINVERNSDLRSASIKVNTNNRIITLIKIT